MNKTKILLLLVCVFCLTGCKPGKRIESDKTEYSILINEANVFVYTFKDPNTGVWYIASNHGGLTPRLSGDTNTLYGE